MRNLRICFVVLLFLALLLSACDGIADSRKSGKRDKINNNDNHNTSNDPSPN